MNTQKLNAMKGSELVAYADKLGVHLNCNKERTGLKESKASAIKKIVAFENAHEPVKKTTNTKGNGRVIDLVLPNIVDGLSDFVQVPYKTNRNYITVKTRGGKPKRLGEVDVLTKKVTVYMRAKIDYLPKGVVFHKFVNNTLGNCYHVSYDCDYISCIRYLLNTQQELL